MLPHSVLTTLWSSDPKKIDPLKHKQIIIANVLNFGDQEATKWIFQYYGQKEIKEIAAKIPAGQWNEKSLNFWSTLLDIKPQTKAAMMRKLK